MRFRYSYQQIVDLKNNERTQAEWILSTALGQLVEEESSLKDLHHEKNELHEHISSTSQNCTRISQIMMVQDYMEHLEQRITKKNEDVQTAKKIVVHKREHLSEKMLDEKVWMKAKDKAYQNFNLAALKKEQEALDEITTNRFKRLS